MEQKDLLLRDPGQTPDIRWFKEILSDQLFQTYELLQDILSEHGLSSEWRYYNDGKSWLCKVSRKKKTVFWLSLWEGYFQCGFYFTEKTSGGLMELELNETIRHAFLQQKPIGKLIPLILELKAKNDLGDLRRVAEYKMSLK